MIIWVIMDPQWSYDGHDHVYYTWIRSVLFGIHALFPLPRMGMPALRIIRSHSTWLFLGSHFLVPWLFLVLYPSYIYYKVFRKSSTLLTSDFRGICYTLVCNLHRLGDEPVHMEALTMPFSQSVCTFRALSLSDSLTRGGTFWLSPIALMMGGK